MKLPLAMLVLGLAAVPVALGFTTTTGAETAQDSSPRLFREPVEEGADSPSGRLLLRVPSASGKHYDSLTVEAATPPVEPSEPAIEEEDAPTYFGEPIADTFLLILDCSESMETSDGGGMGLEDSNGNMVSNPTRLEIVKIESIRALNSLTESNQFDIIQLAGNTNHEGLKFTPPLTSEWKGSLVPGDRENIDAAVEFVQNMGVWWGTPTYTALHKACTAYGDAIGTLILLSDGAPTWCDIPTLGSDEPMWQSSNAQRVILAEFPQWYSPMKEQGCEFKCIHIGNHFAAGSFLQELASQNSGSYLHIE